jgi:hypothetical protein
VVKLAVALGIAGLGLLFGLAWDLFGYKSKSKSEPQ